MRAEKGKLFVPALAGSNRECTKHAQRVLSRIPEMKLSHVSQQTRFVTYIGVIRVHYITSLSIYHAFPDPVCLLAYK